ncbi:hypothetical protein HID58_004667, partial [Brassica napus]
LSYGLDTFVLALFRLSLGPSLTNLFLSASIVSPPPRLFHFIFTTPPPSSDAIDLAPLLLSGDDNEGSNSNGGGEQRRSSSVRRPWLREAARLLSGSSSGGGRAMREPSMVVREAAAEQLEERQSNWAYSKPIVVLDIVWNLAFVSVAGAILVMARNEHPIMPLMFDSWGGGIGSGIIGLRDHVLLLGGKSSSMLWVPGGIHMRRS